ncbi:MAG: flagellar basal-body rod protein FlgF [Geobacteraceae bacterium]|nr:flagellar basal-body rod protein FlgF [Geobacteraceae bacterium]
MNSGMYSALSGNLAAMKRMDIISNNLANVNTPGFKKDKMTFEGMLSSATMPPAVPASMTADPILQKENIYIDYAAGPVSQTGNPLDMAIDGDGFFVVSTPDGPAYTRQGNFRLSADGTLVTNDNFPVQGQGGGSIRISGSRIEIDSKGVVNVDGTPAGTISMVDFPKPYALTKTGSALFVPTNAGATPQAAKGELRQAHLEGSNVETISEMVQMIETSRYFDACQRTILSFNDMTSKAANDLGKL